MTETFETGSANVYADLDLPDAEERLLKSKLSVLIKRSIEARGLSQATAAALVGMPQPDISAIVCGRLKGFSAERLIRALNALGNDVEIVEADAGVDQVGHQATPRLSLSFRKVSGFESPKIR